MPRARAKPTAIPPRPEPPTLVGSFPDEDYTPTRAAQRFADAMGAGRRALPVWSEFDEGWQYANLGLPRFRGHFKLDDGERTYTIELEWSLVWTIRRELD
jgi:hypothetical protein